MAITPTFPENAVRDRFKAFLAIVVKRQIERMQYLGELCVKHAKSVPAEVGFTDQTGNLRSSMGYIVFHDGIPVEEFFENVPAKVKKGKAKTPESIPDQVQDVGTQAPGTGMQTGREYALMIGKQHPEGVVLVVVAGMSYALHVEAKGRDVLASAERLALEELPKMLQSLVDNINKAAA